nr:MAG TPA: hypothetical protein [Caudoviricetes sp.]
MSKGATMLRFIQCLPGSLYRTMLYASHLPFWKWF